MSYFENTDWKSQRLGKFTSSEVWKLMKGGRKKDEVFGQTALTYINEKTAEILTGQAPEQVFAKALEWGAANELDAILTFQEQTGLAVEHFGVGNPQFFPYYGIAGGSPDGLTDLKVIEVKCPYTSANHVEFLKASYSDDPSGWLKENNEAYYYQCQLNILACDKMGAYLVSYDSRVLNHEHRLAVLAIERDSDFEAEIKMRLDLAKEIVKKTLNIFQPVTA
jgi:hypothetical protein